ncbi:AzlD domain-containing protein [Egicoccus sp. AB-alg2]|uniref:AzlD domain-containing protein n=1 Tax=Egicoccus sp. AB-alg2 TaxID=3242693 RepID=UPI00359DB13F
MPSTTLWIAVLAGSLGCYGIKLAGLSVPDRVLEDPRVRRIAAMLPIALLAALIAVQTVADGTALGVDARVAGVGVAIVAVLLRAPFLVVVLAAMATTALLRL